MSWATPVTWTAGQVVGASDLNAQVRDNMNFLLSGKVFNNIRYLGVANKTLNATNANMAAIDTTNLRFSWVGTTGRVRGGWGGFVSYDDAGHVGNAYLSTLLDSAAVDGGSNNDTLYIPHQYNSSFWYPFGFTGLTAASHAADMCWRISTAGSPSSPLITLSSTASIAISGELEEL